MNPPVQIYFYGNPHLHCQFKKADIQKNPSADFETDFAHVGLKLLLFSLFQDGHIDFKELSCGVSAACRGPDIERQKCKKYFVLRTLSCFIMVSLITKLDRFIKKLFNHNSLVYLKFQSRDPHNLNVSGNPIVTVLLLTGWFPRNNSRRHNSIYNVYCY